MQFYQLILDNAEQSKGSCIALLGGGGKTTLLHKLAEEFASDNTSVLQTSLTKTAFHQSDNPLILNEIDIDKFTSLKYKMNPLFIIGEKINNEKLMGISEIDLENIRHYFDITIFECDGARNRPLKAHTEYDPQVPEFATHAIIIVGADAVNTTVGGNFVHRPELFCKTWNVRSDFILDIDFMVNVVSSQKGYLSKVPDEVEIIYFVNKWDDHQMNAEDLGKAIFKKTRKPTFYGSVKKNILNQIHL